MPRVKVKKSANIPDHVEGFAEGSEGDKSDDNGRYKYDQICLKKLACFSVLIGTKPTASCKRRGRVQAYTGDTIMECAGIYDCGGARVQYTSCRPEFMGARV